MHFTYALAPTGESLSNLPIIERRVSKGGINTDRNHWKQEDKADIEELSDFA